MLIMGLSFGYHDSSVSLIRNGEVIFAAQEERFSRIKHDNTFPRKSIEECLKYKNIKISDIDYFIYYEDSFKKIKRIIKSNLYQFIKSLNFFYILDLIDTCCSYVKDMKLNIIELIVLELQVDKKKVRYVEHHQSHAASAFYNSNYSNATILTIDGVGEEETLTLSVGKKNNIEKIKKFKFPYSLGLFYSTITSFLGFEINEGEYKVMGLAAYGKPIYRKKVDRLIFFESGNFHLDMSFFNFTNLKKDPFTKKFIEHFGSPVDKNFYKLNQSAENKKFIYYANLASSFQSLLEDVLDKIFEYSINITKIKNICYAGGVALNAVANSKLLAKYKNLFIYPAAGDSGCSAGAAQMFYYHVLKKKRKLTKTTMYLGKNYTSQEIEKALQRFNVQKYTKYSEQVELYSDLAKLLDENMVIGWFSGRSEFGPRALGSRSIIANPKNRLMKDIINNKIKFRESFRPFAPIILKEKIFDYFDIKEQPDSFHPSNFMISVYKSKLSEKFASAVNVDNTARVQIIPKNSSKIRKLLEIFNERTGLPILINTSFNRKGEAIVEDPIDALNVFYYTDIDYLVLENYLIKK